MTASPSQSSLTQPLRDEHRDLLPHVEQLCATADAVGSGSVASLREGVEEAYRFLAHHLLIHAQAEEQALYPVVERVMGAPEATATMRRDHVEVARLTDELRSLRQDLEAGTLAAEIASRARRLLYGLYALLKVHFAKEEEVYLPLLDARLTPDEARQMFAAMEKAAGEAHGRLDSGGN
jgi:iron-sulfur cluster repair protein YtfE (RIC family)